MYFEEQRKLLLLELLYVDKKCPSQITALELFDMRPDKINLLEGEWTRNVTGTPVYTNLLKSGFRALREQTLPLTRLYDDNYWGVLRSVHTVFLAKLDFRHWYYDDDVFYEYMKRVSSIRFPAICLFDSPFGHEMPNVDIDVFEKKLFDRTKVFYNTIKHKHPDTIIVSPSICITDERYRDRYRDYFVHNRRYFDVYSMHCSYDVNEQNTALLMAFLNEVLQIAPKEVWVTRWSVPSSDVPIMSPSTMGGITWHPVRWAEASHHMLNVFQGVEDLTKHKTRWFFTGCGFDEYHPDKQVQEPLWVQYPHLYPKSTLSWNYSHFLGLLTYDNKVKEPILDTLLKLHEQNK